MHLSRLIDQVKRHPSPTQALDKLGRAMDKHEGSLLEKGFRILKSELCANMYEAINGPHFDEEHARYAVAEMENEDGTKGPHWTVEETTSIASQIVVSMTGGANTKHFAELAKAWLCDKDISEGKMWHYYVYIMCDDEDNDYKAYEHEYRDHPEYEHMGRERRMRYVEPYDYTPKYRMGRSRYDMYDAYDKSHFDEDREDERMRDRDARNTSVRYF